MSAEQCSDAIDPWRGFTMSPKGLFPGFVSNCRSDECSFTPNGDSEKKLEQKEDGLGSVVGRGSSGFKSGGSIAERRAAKFGFDASKINTSRFESSNALASLASPSPYLLRTPGISPGALLESPMMLPNLQPSPTTGAFALPRLAFESGEIRSEPSKAEKDSDDTSSFTFNPNGKPIPMSCYSATQNQYLPGSLPQHFGFQHQAATLPPVNGGFEFPTQPPSEANVNTSEFNSSPDSRISSEIVVKASSSDFQPGDSIIAAGFEVQQNECNQREDAGNSGTDHHPSDGDLNVMDSSVKTVHNSEDGYNWRKYGQKQVKASEFPRSYYKCTHPNCPVKKKVEHSRDGQITEVVYKGAHNHQKPQLNRRSSFGSSVSCGESLNVGDGLERTCSTDLSNPPPANEAKSAGALESAGTPELSSTLASNDEVEEEGDAITQGSTAVVDNENDEPELKRRKMESSLIETALASRAIREPRVIVQIESEVDILDDGYRWRKYGQKVVKGNPNPRSYYKCTHPGCSVRKHVERASHNLKFVLTTYEGKHNHEVPSARNSSHQNPAPSAHNPQDVLNSHHLPKSEPQDFATHSHRRMEYNNKEFLKPNYFGNFNGGAPSLYQMNFPNFPNTMPYGSFGLNPNYEPATGQHAPNLSIPPPMGFSLPPNMGIPNNNQGRPHSMIQPMFLAQPQPQKDGDVKLLRQPAQDQ